MLKQTAITVAADGYVVANHERMTALVKILIKRGIGDMINTNTLLLPSRGISSKLVPNCRYKHRSGLCCCQNSTRASDKLSRVFGNEGLGKEVEIRRLN